ncbi:hypothetical protein D3C80_2143460 [compost metagenome]
MAFDHRRQSGVDILLAQEELLVFLPAQVQNLLRDTAGEQGGFVLEQHILQGRDVVGAFIGAQKQLQGFIHIGRFGGGDPAA